MTGLTSTQRKYVYLSGIILLLIPIIWLGRPAGKKGADGAGDSGGLLSQMREKYDLGESSLGNVDPSSATMNLVLLGLRGPATSLLWVELDRLKDEKNWAAMRSTTESIIMLQPHYLKVWEYHGWNLAYNVAVEWDRVADRYYWVKEGTKFYKRGTERNYKYPSLYWHTANTLGNKIGRADEWRFYRKFFLVDPDAKRFTVNGVAGPDQELNPDHKDHYLVAAEWFQKANDVMDTYGKRQQQMERSLFRAYPGRARFDHPAELQKVGQFDEVTQRFWEDAANYWINRYGQDKIPVPFRTDGMEMQLEWTAEQIADYVKSRNGVKQDELDLRKWVNNYQNMSNYRYWRVRALAEKETNTVQAHRELYQAEQALKNGDSIQAEKLALSGMAKYEKVIQDFDGLKEDDMAIEEGLIGYMVWANALRVNEHPMPAEFPLKKMVDAFQDRMSVVKQEFDRRFSATE